MVFLCVCGGFFFFVVCFLLHIISTKSVFGDCDGGIDLTFATTGRNDVKNWFIIVQKKGLLCRLKGQRVGNCFLLIFYGWFDWIVIIQSNWLDDYYPIKSTVKEIETGAWLLSLSQHTSLTHSLSLSLSLLVLTTGRGEIFTQWSKNNWVCPCNLPNEFDIRDIGGTNWE